MLTTPVLLNAVLVQSDFIMHYMTTMQWNSCRNTQISILHNVVLAS